MDIAIILVFLMCSGHVVWVELTLLQSSLPQTSLVMGICLTEIQANEHMPFSLTTVIGSRNVQPEPR